MKSRAKIIAVTSGKRGVGKTTIVVNLGILFSKLGKRVCLIDGDYGLGNINQLLGLPSKKQPKELFEKNFNPSKVMLKSDWGLDILSSASGINQQQPILAPSSSQVKRMVQKLAGDYDIIIVDTAAGIAASVQNYLEVADRVLLIIESNPTVLTKSFAFIKNMRSVQVKYSVVVNRATNGDSAKEVFNRFSSIVDQFIELKLENLGYIQEDSFTSAAMLSQSPLVIYSSHCHASRCLSAIVTRLSASFSKTDLETPAKSKENHTSRNEKCNPYNDEMFNHWLIQMSKLLAEQETASEKSGHLFSKERRREFIAELGALCLKNDEIMKSFENMVIEKRINKDHSMSNVIDETTELERHDQQINGQVIRPIKSNLSVEKQPLKEKVVKLSDYA